MAATTSKPRELIPLCLATDIAPYYAMESCGTQHALGRMQDCCGLQQVAEPSASGRLHCGERRYQPLWKCLGPAMECRLLHVLVCTAYREYTENAPRELLAKIRELFINKK